MPNHTPKHPTSAEKFHARITRQPETGCWIWNGSMESRIYLRDPAQSDDGNLIAIRPARASWILHFGEPPADRFVLRTCTTQNCVAPHHLRLHCWPHLRTDCHAKGPDNGNTKLTADIIRQIRRSTEPPSRIATKFGVHLTNICHIRAGRTWKHVQ